MPNDIEKVIHEFDSNAVGGKRKLALKQSIFINSILLFIIY